MNHLLNFYLKYKKIVLSVSIILFFIFFLLPLCTIRTTRIGSPYTKKEDVALYIMQHHELPPNYITKEGFTYLQEHGLKYGGYIIGGDSYFETWKIKDDGISSNTKLKECDIVDDQYGIPNHRGALRLVYTCNTKNVRVFFTSDHYNSFTELSKFELQLTSNVLWIIFAIYVVLMAVFYVLIFVANKKHKSDALSYGSVNND